MSPDDSTVDEAAPDAAAPAEADANEAEAGEEDEKARWRRALDFYLEGRLTESLALVDAILEANPESDLRPRLERLRRRAADRIETEPEGEEPEEDAEADADAPEDVSEAEAEGGDEGSSDEDPSSGDDEASEVAEAPEEAAPTSEQAAEAATEVVEAAPEPAAATPAEASGAATKTEEDALSQTPSGRVVRVETPPPESKVAKKQARAGGVRRVVRKPAAPASGVTSGSGAAVKSTAAPGPAAVKAATGPSKLHPNAATKIGVEKIHGSVENVAKLIRGLETNLVRIAEAYQRVTLVSKRKEQAYDQLYEELRTYKDNFLLSAQKPLFKDILLLYDGVRRAQKRFEDGEEQVSREDAIKAFQDILEEILEVLYRRDIERIEEQPERLEIDFQKPVRRIETDDPNEDKQVDQIVRDGFRMDGAILRPQEVVVKRCLKEKGQS
ncbi:MAG: nucleotide exchange factor GrpE [Planctomycetes bacterium]|nr:nucleotide exchange factor GrpE [Planctomycetota bacterium]